MSRICARSPSSRTPSRQAGCGTSSMRSWPTSRTRPRARGQRDPLRRDLAARRLTERARLRSGDRPRRDSNGRVIRKPVMATKDCASSTLAATCAPGHPGCVGSRPPSGATRVVQDESCRFSTREARCVRLASRDGPPGGSYGRTVPGVATAMRNGRSGSRACRMWFGSRAELDASRRSEGHRAQRPAGGTYARHTHHAQPSRG